MTGICQDLLMKAMEIHGLDVSEKDTSIRRHKWDLVTEYYNGVKHDQPGQMRTKEQLRQFMKRLTFKQKKLQKNIKMLKESLSQ